LFLDVTDTWFVGDGPALATRGKTKEGRDQRKVGIVLLCNEHGLPLRWEVLSGSEADNVAMPRMLRSVAKMSWASRTPLVCDRAMGRTAQIREMLATELHFVTAVTVTEFEAYAETLPHPSFADLDVPDNALSPAELEQLVEQAARRAEASGLEKMDDDLFVRDLGVVVRADVGDEPPCSTNESEKSEGEKSESVTMRAMRLALAIEDDVAQGRSTSNASAGRALGLHKGVVGKYLRLRQLSEQQRHDVLAGKTAHCSLDALLSVAAVDNAGEQQKAFDALVASPPPRKRSRLAPARPTPVSKTMTAQKPIRVRVALYFNPERFVEQRHAARCKLHRVTTFVTELRAKLLASPGRYGARKVSALIDRKLREESLLDAFTVKVSADASQGSSVLSGITPTRRCGPTSRSACSLSSSNGPCDGPWSLSAPPPKRPSSRSRSAVSTSTPPRPATAPTASRSSTPNSKPF
jgi:hypothetical protein